MKRSITGPFVVGLCALLAVALASIISQARDEHEDLIGLWQGTLTFPGVESRIVLRLTEGRDAALAATLLLPDHTDSEIPADDAVLDGSELRVTVSAVRGSFVGRINAERTAIDGRWEQGRWSHAVVLKRIARIVQPHRPQTPRPPFPYDEIPVTFANEAADAQFAGTLTAPRGEGPFPTALLISGGGGQDRNGTFLRHRPLHVLADHLTRRGIAVLRVDDRGVGASTGVRAQATSADYAEDALAGVAFLKNHPRVNAARIGLIGHSEGGTIATLAAAKSPDIAFIIMLASPGLPGTEYNYQFEAASGRALGQSEATIAAKRKLQERIFAVIKTENDPAAAEREVRRILREMDPGLPEARLDAAVARFLSPWVRFSLTHDPAATLRKVKCPVLALFGEKDVQVPPAGNVEAIDRALRGAEHQNYAIAVLPSLNHFFQTCRTGSPTEYGRIEETFAPAALKRITDWLLDHTARQ